jgi:N-acetylmuramoyl-L-alanine amidase
MGIHHTVAQGESVISLSERYGFFAETLWNHPENAALKGSRKDMNTLLPGDVVFIPDLRPKEVPAATAKRHPFRRRGVPAKFHLQVFDGEKPRADQQYQLTVDGRVSEGTTDGEGILHEWVPPGARQGELCIGPDRFTASIRFGHMDPIETLSGVQRRLNNVGYDCGGTGGELDPHTRKALRAFQSRFDLPVTGEPDPATLDKLQEVHDRPHTYPEDRR